MSFNTNIEVKLCIFIRPNRSLLYPKHNTERRCKNKKKLKETVVEQIVTGMTKTFA